MTLAALFRCSLALFLSSTSLAFAQDPSPSEPSASDGTETIIIRGSGLIGQSRGTIEPELTLAEGDIAAYGASTIGELIGELLPETSSGRGRGGGRPVVLLNGRRVTSFREVARYPIEAVARVEVLPEEVSLSYGFSANQRVLNFVLKAKVTVSAVEADFSMPEDGGTNTVSVSGQRLFVDGDTRLSVDAKGTLRAPLLEGERDIAFADASNTGTLRTLLSDQEQWEAGFSAGTAIWSDNVGTLSGSFARDTQANLRGEDLSAPGTALPQTQGTDTLTLGASLLSGLAPTTWTLSASHTLVDADTSTAFNAVLDDAQTLSLRDTSSRNSTTALDAVVTSKIAEWETGSLSITGQAGFTSVTQTAAISAAGITSENRVKRDTFTGRASADAPIDLPGPLPGQATFNANVQLDDLSDFGTLLTYGYGVTWEPIGRLRIIASATREEGAPSLSEIGDPTVITPDVRVFDFASGENVFASTITGGNPNLGADSRRVLKLGIQFQPKERGPLRFNVDYTRSRITNETRTFPLLTEEFEAAFPDRVLRDDSGALISFDLRPVLAAQTRRDELRTAINWSKRLGRRGPPPGASRRPGPSAQGGAGGKPPAGARSRRSGRPGSIRIAAYHRWILSDDVTIAPGIAQFDFLNGSASGNSGGTARHEFDLSVRRYNKGVGIAATLNYQTGTTVIAQDGALSFSDLLQSNLRLSYDFNFADKILKAAPFLKDTRIVFEGSNLLNEKVQVREADGSTPLAFQQDILDPIGRSWRIEIRRRF